MKLNLLTTTLILSNLTNAIVLPQAALNLDNEVESFYNILSSSSSSDFESLPLVDSTELQDLITEEALLSRAKKLYDIAGYSNKSHGHPTRVIGSKGHWATIAYIKHELKKLNGYYNVSIQPFKAFMSEIFYINATINNEIPKSLVEMDMSPSTPHKKPVFGDLSLVSNSGCKDEDYTDVDGKIAFIKRGDCAFGDKAQLAAKYGALAAIIYNNEPGEIRGTLGVPPDGVKVAPCVGISKEEGDKYVDLLNNGEVLKGMVLVDSFVGPITTVNVIAETVHGDPENIVMLGAHSDSVGAGPGINDDGSGTISLLEVATQLTKFSVKNKVRFAFWAAEEEGLLGSNYYANKLITEENQKIRLFMDYDMMASPNYEYEIYDANNIDNPKGSEELKNLYIDYYTERGFNYTLIPFDGRSDYVGFIENGIPGGGIAAGAEKHNAENGEVLDRCYHQLCDDLTNIAWDAFLVNTQLIAHSVATYGADLSTFPVREVVDDSMLNFATFAYRGNKLII
jgi:aminopeptidase Y